MFIAYFAGTTKAGKIVAVAICQTSAPDTHLASLGDMLPFKAEVIGVEPGDATKFQEVRTQFQAHHLNGIWYRPDAELISYAKALGTVEVHGPRQRVSLDLEPEEFADLEAFVKELGGKTKAALLRRAYRFYRALYRYKAQGWLIQAVKGGRLVQFPDLEDIPKQD